MGKGVLDIISKCTMWNYVGLIIGSPDFRTLFFRHTRRFRCTYRGLWLWFMLFTETKL